MDKIRKIGIGFVIGIVTVVILSFAAVLILPKLIESETLKTKIRSEFSRAVGGEIDFDRLDFSVFPLPHVTLDKASVRLPNKFAGAAEMISVYPKILLLLSGKISFREIRLQQPDVTLTLQKPSGEEKPPAKPLAAGDLMRQIVSVLEAHPAPQLPDVAGYVKNGRFKLMVDGRAAIELDHIDVRLTNAAGSLTFQITGTSAAVENVSISGTADTREARGSARFQLTRLQPQVIRDAFSLDSSLEMEAEPVDLTLDVNLGGPGQMQADIAVSIPELTLAREDKIMEMRNRELRGRVDLDQNSAAASLAELVLDYPQMSVSGHLTSSLDGSQLRLEVNGRNIDVAATRRAALSLAGENDVVRGIFEVVKGGSVPQITLTAQGKALSDLGNTNELVIRGQMRDGNISIPGVQLDLTETAGDVVISRGILEGQNLRARLGNSTGQNGKLKLGLVGEEAPFHLEIDVQADLSQLPPILDRLVEEKDFRSELAKIKELKGTANGKLILGEDTENVTVTVDASEINLTARYGRIPYPVDISGGNFFYTKSRIGVGQLSGSLGKSTFSDLTGDLESGNDGDLEISSGRCGLYLAEIVPWLASFDALRGTLTFYGGEKGVLTVSALKLKGPLQKPRDWRFDVSGEIEDLILKNLPLQPGPLTIAALKFKADQTEFAYTDGRFGLQDAIVKMSGTQRDYLKGFDENVSLTLEGRLGPQFIEWLSRALGAPSWLKLQPLTLSPSRLHYVKSERNTLSASLAVQEGLEVSTDLLMGGDELNVTNLLIQDRVSRAAIGLRVKGSAVDLTFDGKIYQQTLDHLFREKSLVAESIDGNLHLRWDINDPSRFSTQGDLRGRDIFVAYDAATPLKINAFALRGDASRIRIDAADLKWGEMPLKISGTLQPEPDKRLGVDMDIAADAVDLDHLLQVLKTKSSNEEPQTDPKSQSLEVVGKIRFKTDRLTFGDFIWSPLQADVFLHKEKTDVTIKEAGLCGISTPGTLTLSPETIQFDIQPTAKDQDLNSSLNCFAADRSTTNSKETKTVETIKADGTYSLQGNIKGNGKAEDLLKSATGQMEYSAVNGHIYRDVVLLNVLKYLNATELLTGQTDLNKMRTSGFGYRAIRIEGSLQNGKISYNKIILDGAALALTAEGDLDLLSRRLDLILLVALQTTLDRIFEKIPLVGGALQTFNTIPLSLKGTLDDLRVFPLAPSAVAYELKRLMENTARGPIKLIQIGRKSAADAQTP